MEVRRLSATPGTRVRRNLAVRTAIAWTSSGLLMILVAALLGADGSDLPIVIAIGAACLAWAAFCLLLPPTWAGVGSLFGVGTVLALVMLPIAIAASGGADSPLRAIFFLIVVNSVWFFGPRPAVAVLVAVTVLHLLPLVYDDDADSAASVGETIVMAVAFLGAGGAMIAGRHELMRLRDTAREEALRDPLTELANRRALVSFLDERAGGRRADDRLGVALIDLDGLKHINTRHGHAGGDAALLATAEALSRSAREGDLVARLGGDEFVIVAPGIRAADLARLAERAVAAIRATSIELPEVRLSASAGTAMLPDDAISSDQLLLAADAALGAAKRAGKSRVRASGQPEPVV